MSNYRCIISIRVSDTEKKSLTREAEEKQTTITNLFRQAKGLPPIVKDTSSNYKGGLAGGPARAKALSAKQREQIAGRAGQAKKGKKNKSKKNT